MHERGLADDELDMDRERLGTAGDTGRGTRGDRFASDRDERVADDRDTTVTRDERA